jgi:hypothetical protein
MLANTALCWRAAVPGQPGHMRAHASASCSSAKAACAAGFAGKWQRSSSAKTTATCKRKVSEASAGVEQASALTRLVQIAA